MTALFLMAALLLGANANSQNGMSSSAPKINASAVWQPPQDVFAKATRVCQVGAGPMSFSACYMNQLAAQGEPPAAAEFTRWLFDHFDANVGIMTAFKSYGPVDAAQALFPLRANDNDSLLFLNGDPAVIDVDDLQKLDRTAMENAPVWQQLKQKYPNADLWPGDRSGSDPWPQWQASPDGGSRFVVQYPIINGCHACARVGQAQFAWEFDRNGKFVRVTYLGLRTTTS
jgi:hypothetical protein